MDLINKFERYRKQNNYNTIKAIEKMKNENVFNDSQIKEINNILKKPNYWRRNNYVRFIYYLKNLDIKL